MLFLLYLPVLVLCLLLYFKLAVKYNIIDKPNHRSSHKHFTIRGGGIVFPIAFLLEAQFSEIDYSLFLLGLLLISLVSFYDDIQSLSNKTRLLVHFIAISMLFIEANFFKYPIWIIVPAYILVIGTINAYNFMDGINGITGGYSLITILSLWLINVNHYSFISNNWLMITALSLLVFNFFNFRKKPKCFAGDVGSISMSFIIIFFLLQLIIKSGDLKYIGFLLVYGIDSISTILFRLIRKENIFVAHRTHFYQFLTNLKSLPHLLVSALYMIVQLIINLLIFYSDWDSVDFLIFIVVSGLVFLSLRLAVEGRFRLMGK